MAMTPTMNMITTTTETVDTAMDLGMKTAAIFKDVGRRG